ncbi:MAG: ribonuclease H-like domain-containing protein [Chlamydiae bacterium]|nr:ribonuclease H-like domain-containing protein [Chlamydiota bacterium]
MNYIVLDIETQKAFSDIDRRYLDQLGVSVVGIYQSKTNQYTAYEEKELSGLNQILSEASLMIGFNIKSFDYPVLQPHLEIPLQKLPTLDILEEIKNALGHRVSLNSVAQATLGKSKTGDGLEAIRLYKAGEIEKIKAYCLNDVQLTKEVYEYGLRHQSLHYLSKDGTQRLDVKVNWTPLPASQTQEMFLF